MDSRSRNFRAGFGFLGLAKQIGVKPGSPHIGGSEFLGGFEGEDGLVMRVRDVDVVGVMGHEAGEQSEFGIVGMLLKCRAEEVEILFETLGDFVLGDRVR